MKTNNIKRNILLIALILTLALCSFALYFINYRGASAEVSLGTTTLKTEYAFGESITIPNRDITVEGETFSVQPTILTPNGSYKKVSQLTLNEVGEYVLEYSVVKDGKFYSASDSFDVYNYTFSNSTTNAPLIYKEITYKQSDDKNVTTVQMNGLAFSVKQSEKIVSNMSLDLSKATKDDVVISLDATPTVSGVPEARDLFVRFTDVYDEKNYFTVRIRRHPNDGGQIINYGVVFASYGNQRYLTRLNGELTEHENYGVFISNGMIGQGKKPIELYYDNEEKAIYAYNENATIEKVVNFNEDYNTPWSGFTTGEVYVSIWAELYESIDVEKPFNGVIFSAYGMDIAEGLNVGDSAPLYRVEDTKAPSIDFGEYASQKNIPDAMVGFPYYVYDCYGYSTYVKEEPSIKVYYGYNSSSRYSLEVKDGAFVPIHDGVHTIEYTVKDIFGNVATKLVDVYARKNTQKTFDVSLSGYESCQVGKVGETLILPDFGNATTSGNLGSVKYTIIAKHSSGSEQIVENYLFVPQKGGEWEISYIATDAVERTGKFTFDVNIEVDSAVVFKTIKDWNNYLIVGAKNPIPNLEVIDYNLDGKEGFADKVYYQKGNEDRVEITNGYFVPSEAGDYSIIYEATSSKNVTTTKTYSAKAIEVGFPNNILMDKYFYSQAIVSSQTMDNSVLLTVNPNQIIDFIRPINGKDIYFSFNFSAGTTATGIDIYLTDINNFEQAIKLTIKTEVGGVSLIVNDEAKRELSGFTFGGGADFSLTISGGVLTINSSTIQIDNYLNGKKFSGFDTQLVNLSVCVFSNLSNPLEFIANAISKQKFSNINEDYTAPALISKEPIASRFFPGEIIKISSAKVIDVLDPFTSASLSVIAPNGQALRDDDGTLLENVAIDKDYFITLKDTGTYKVRYNISDSAGNGGSQLGFRVISREKPIIIVDTEEDSCDVGDEIEIRTASVQSVSKNVNLYIFIQQPGSSLKELSRNKKGEYEMQVVLDVEGRCLVRYMAVDEWNNVTIADYYIVVS